MVSIESPIINWKTPVSRKSFKSHPEIGEIGIGILWVWYLTLSIMRFARFSELSNVRRNELNPLGTNLHIFIGKIPTNSTREFHVETTWKRSLPPRFNVEYTWCVCREARLMFIDKVTGTTRHSWIPCYSPQI